MTDSNDSSLPASLRWARRYLSEYFSDDSAPFHAELLHDLEQPQNRYVARVAPRGHAKSTCAALAFPLWCICTRRRRNIVILTQERSLATQFVRDIREQLETNDALRADYGDLTSAPPDPDDDGDAPPEIQAEAAKQRRRKPARRRWREGLFTTASGITVQARGAGGSFRGVRVGPQRPDLVICDDIEKDEHVESPEQRARLERWLRRVVMPALAPHGQLVLLGSIIHYDSLLAGLRDRKRWPRWDYKVYRALEAAPRTDDPEAFDLVALWPARWPVARLKQEREQIGTTAFEQEYQANPIDTSLRVFRPEMLVRYDEAELANKELVTLLAVDPATGAAGGDFFAIWVGALDIVTGTLYTRVLQLERIGITEQIRRILALYEQWRPVKVGIETVAYQVALKEVIEEESRRRGLYLPVTALVTTANKRARIEGTAPLYERGVIRLPAALPPEIEEQFLHFPKARHDDAPDVCAMGIELARSLRAARSVEGSITRSGLFQRNGGW